MKLLHLPLNVPGSEQVGQERGFRSVFDTDPRDDYFLFNYLNHGTKEETNTELFKIIEGFEPDIVWAQLQETDTIIPDNWRIIKEMYPKTWLTCWSGDARSEVSQIMQQYLPHFDIFYNDTTQDIYNKFAKDVRFMPVAVDPNELSNYDWQLGEVPDIIFIGNNYGNVFSNGQFRIELMEELTRYYGNKFGVYGNGWNPNKVRWLGTCPVKAQGAYYHKAKVVISVDHIKGILHWSERLVWALGSGTPVVMEHQQGIERYWGTKPSYFTNITNCIDKINTILEKEPIKNQANIDLIVNEHNWVKRAEQVKRDYLSKNKPAVQF